jgi:hypothetical protein
VLDADKYAQHFPDENHHSGALGVDPASANAAVPTHLLLAALARLEKEFSEILRTQANPADPCE